METEVHYRIHKFQPHVTELSPVQNMVLCCNRFKIMKLGTFIAILMNGDTQKLHNTMIHGSGFIAAHRVKRTRVNFSRYFLYAFLCFYNLKKKLLHLFHGFNNLW